MIGAGVARGRRIGWMVAAACACACACACQRSGGGTGAAASANANGAPAASGAPASSVAGGGTVGGDAGMTRNGSAAAGSTESWRGTYAGAPGALYIPRGSDVPNAKDWDGVKFRGDDAGIGRGSGTLVLHIDRTSGTVLGEGDGSAGPFRVYGHLSDAAGHQFSATISRQNPADLGLTGTATGTLDGDHGKGTMKLAESNAVVLRDITFDVTKAP